MLEAFVEVVDIMIIINFLLLLIIHISFIKHTGLFWSFIISLPTSNCSSEIIFVYCIQQLQNAGVIYFTLNNQSTYHSHH